MDKIYGYKEQDIIGLANFLKQHKGQSLSSLFEQYAILNGKAKGTIRNLYYALAKRSSEDKAFCDKYLDGKVIAVSKIIEFDGVEEKALIKKILIERQNGKSVRSTIMDLSSGDGKVALRYQNKYRNAIKNKPLLISQIIEEIKKEGHVIKIEDEKQSKQSVISNAQFEKLKNEIDNLANRLSAKLKKENEYLKQRIGVLENENLKLLTLLYGNEKPADARKYFRIAKQKEFIN